MNEREIRLKKLERDLGHIDFWYAVQMAGLVFVGSMLLGLLV